MDRSAFYAAVERVLAAVLAFLRGATPLTTGCAAVACTLLFFCGLPGSGLLDPQMALHFLVPSGSQRIMVISDDLVAHLAQLPNVLALVPFLGWILAMLAGVRRGTPSGVEVLAKHAIVILAVAGATSIGYLYLMRMVLNSDPFMSGTDQLMPMISYSSLEHWRWALRAAFVTFVALGVLIVRKRRQPR